MRELTFSDLSAQFRKSELASQFVLCRDEFLCPNDWDRLQVKEFCLGYHSNLKLHRFNSIDGRNSITVLGRVDAGSSDQIIEAELNGSDDVIIARIEQLLDQMIGRFICIVEFEETLRIYLDSSGSLSTIYCAEQGIVASTIGLVPYTETTSDDVPLARKMRIHDSNSVYPLGLTPRAGVERLLPNHYLDLTTWEQIRHWPRETVREFENRREIEWAINEMANEIQRCISFFSRDHRIYMSLTAGFDSRVLLACSRSYIDQIDFFTWELPNDQALSDAKVAAELSEIFDLNYRLFEFAESSKIDKMRWLYRTGLSAGAKSGLKLTSTVSKMKDNEYYLPGLAGEFGRAFYWRDSDHGKTELTASIVLDRLGLPNLQESKEVVVNWLSGLENFDSLTKLDLLYLEHRLGCWAGVTPYGHAEGPFRIHPLSNRKIFDLVLRLPPSIRRNDGLPLMLIRSQWPELLKMPVNDKKYERDSSSSGMNIFHRAWHLFSTMIR